MAFTYADADAVLENALRFGTNPSLDTITALCDQLGRPQDSFRSIQVAGTNGKSSVAWMIEAILAAMEVHAASYTSPHLSAYTERVRIAGTDCGEDEFAAAVGAALDAAAAARIEQPTEFELLTAAALWLMRERSVEAAVLEVGMGGRWDATSVVDPEVAVVTSVGLDHCEHLGDTREEIAAEKACIIAEGTAVVLGPGVAGVESVFEHQAVTVGASVVRVGCGAAPHTFDLPDGMPGYQAANAEMARSAVEALTGEPVAAEIVTRALVRVRLPARFEVVWAAPVVVVDGSHNPQAAHVLSQAIGERFDQPPTVLLAVLDDKDAVGIVEALSGAAGRFAVTRSDSPRALDSGELATVVRAVTGDPPPEYESLSGALTALLGQSESGLVITGSLTVAAEAREALLDM
jgi:dihydrofolate synthase/folylpolyglutamate synthase